MYVEKIEKQHSIRQILDENERLRASQDKMQLQTDLALKKLEFALKDKGGEA